MISKSYFNTIWVMAGKGDIEEKLVTRTWLRQIEPPYLAGHGVAFTIKRWSIRFGVCTPLHEEVNLYDEGDVAVHNLPHWETDTEVLEIKEWASSETEQSDSQESVSLDPCEPESVPLDSEPVNSTTGPKPVSDSLLTSLCPLDLAGTQMPYPRPWLY